MGQGQEAGTRDERNSEQFVDYYVSGYINLLLFYWYFLCENPLLLREITDVFSLTASRDAIPVGWSSAKLRLALLMRSSCDAILS